MSKYYIFISDTLIGFLLDVLLSLAVILSELHEKQERMIELQKKVHRRIYVRDITFLTARSPFYDFLLLSSSTLTPFPSDAMGGILCDAMGDMLSVMIS